MRSIQQLSIYTIVSFLGAGIGFFLIPYLSHFIDPAEYGILSILNSFITLIIPLISLVASGIISVEYYRLKNEQEFASLFTSVQLIPIVPTILLLLLTFLFPQSLANFLEIPAGKEYWLSISVLLAFVTIYVETLLNYNVISKKPLHYAFFNIIRLMIEVSLTIWFVSGLRLGWEGRMWAWLITTVLLCLASFFYFHRRRLLTVQIKASYFWAGVFFGLPLILHTLGKFVINQSNRLFIAKMDSVPEAGIYNVGAQVGLVMLLLVNAVGNFYQPYLYERLTNFSDISQRQIVKMTYTIIGGLFVSLIILTLITPLLFEYLINPKYAKAAIYVFWVGLGYFFWGVYILFAGFIFFQKKTNFLGLLAILNVGVSIFLNYYFINKFGPIGAAYASVVSFFIVAVIIMWRANKYFKLPWLYAFEKTSR